MKKLGELKRINPREVWKNEATEFTPWLRENLPELASTLGLELDLVEREAPVGDFTADLVAKDLNSNRSVIIENQLDTTDHKHLGQILTYAANRKAGVIVWISTEFRDEHRQALEWLNDVNNGDTNFFGLQLELLQIDDSDPAPNFIIIAKPSAWQKGTRKRGEVTPRQQAYHEFFTALVKELKTKAPKITSADSGGYGSWFGFAAGRTGFRYTFSFAQNKRFRVELYIDRGDQEVNKKAFYLLREHQKAIAQEVGQPIEWEGLDAKRACRVAIYRGDSHINGPPEAHAELRKWAVQTMILLSNAMTPRIKQLNLEGS